MCLALRSESGTLAGVVAAITFPSRGTTVIELQSLYVLGDYRNGLAWPLLLRTVVHTQCDSVRVAPFLLEMPSFSAIWQRLGGSVDWHVAVERQAFIDAIDEYAPARRGAASSSVEPESMRESQECGVFDVASWHARQASTLDASFQRLSVHPYKQVAKEAGTAEGLHGLAASLRYAFSIGDIQVRGMFTSATRVALLAIGVEDVTFAPYFEAVLNDVDSRFAQRFVRLVGLQAKARVMHDGLHSTRYTQHEVDTGAIASSTVQDLTSDYEKDDRYVRVASSWPSF